MTVTINGSTGITTPGQSNTGNSTVSGVATFATTIGVGNATPASTGAGVTFPASQSSSSDANTLDDYEEGTWTPVLSFGGGSTGIVYTTQLGRYTKIGNTVTVNMYFALSNKGSSTGTASISGLPFSVVNVSNFYPGGAFRMGSSSGLSGAPQFYTQYNNNTISIEVGGTTTALTQANFTNTSDICFSYSYQTS